MDADIGLIGLAVMGQNLVMNMNDHGYTVAVWNRTTPKVDAFLEGPAKGSKVIGAHSLKEFVSKLKRPRKIMLMVRAGQAVDDIIAEVLPFLEKGDIIIDGGNSHYPDTNRRVDMMKEKGMHFIGTGISGGEEGARHGPSIMPGGDEEAWPEIKEIFQAISAKADDGAPCCDWVGDGGAGHYVKMVHNGIEYGDMQIICEGYHLMHNLLGYGPDELHKVFAKWNEGQLDSYLIEITRDIFAFKENGKPLVDEILDVAGQKGTGKWTGISALDMGQPLTLIGEAVFARCLSALKDERVMVSKEFGEKEKSFFGDKEEFVENIREALYASKIISYAQGFMLIRAAAKEFKWKLNYSSIALMWRGGCIIRSAFLGDIGKAFEKNHDLECLILDDFFKKELKGCVEGWRKTVMASAEYGIASPCFNTALSFYDGLRTERLPANLLQAQRDFFGAHTYERLDQPRGKFFHTNWTGTGGDVSSSTYSI